MGRRYFNGSKWDNHDEFDVERYGFELFWLGYYAIDWERIKELEKKVDGYQADADYHGSRAQELEKENVLLSQRIAELEAERAEFVLLATQIAVRSTDELIRCTICNADFRDEHKDWCRMPFAEKIHKEVRELRKATP